MMKRFLCVALAFALALSLAACGGGSDTGSSAADNAGIAGSGSQEDQAPLEDDAADAATEEEEEGPWAALSFDEEAREFLNDADLESAEFKGDCGEDARWYYLDGVLVIEGAGKVETAPWADEAFLEVNWIIVGEGITDLSCRVTFPYEDTFLTKVTLPSTLESLFAGFGGVFEDAENLTYINLPDSLTSLGFSTFSGCGSLKSITIPDGVELIGFSTFHGCGSLESITLPDSVTYIDENAFYGCYELTSITLPDNLEHIGNRVFGDCSSLTSITIPDSVTEIGTYAFDFCDSLTEINYSGPAEGYPWGAPLL